MRLMGVRLAIALTLGLVACSGLAGPPTPVYPPQQPRSVAQTTVPPRASATLGPLASATPRPLASAALDCSVSWSESFRSIQAMVDRAEIVARGRVVAQGPTLLYAYDATGRSPRDARVTTLRMSEVFKGAPVDELKVVEDVCPGLSTGDDEWIVFAVPVDTRYGPEEAGPHFFTIGGPQGQLRLSGGRVAGPYFRFQTVARGLAGAPLADLAAELRAAHGTDAAARAIFQREGWTVIRAMSVSELTLPPAADFAAPFQYLCGEASLSHCADLSARIGLDLRRGADGDARVLRFVLEFPTPIGGGPYPPTGVAVAVGPQVVGAWVQSAVTRDVYAVSPRASVPVDRR